MDSEKLNLLFIINPGSGNKKRNFADLINDFFKNMSHEISIFTLTRNCNIKTIQSQIEQYKPDRVIAVGGDGTVKLVAECVLEKKIPMYIIPAGSANGMAKEFNIPANPRDALYALFSGTIKTIHALRINSELSIHLADIGVNAHIVQQFQKQNQRGMIGYAKAALRAFKKKKRIELSLCMNGETIQRKAQMVVIANGTCYGTGVKINRDGSLYDNTFEIVILKWFSVMELLKMLISFKIPFNPFRTEIIHTQNVGMIISKKAFFQVDGEYIGKVKALEAKIILNAIQIVVPE